MPEAHRRFLVSFKRGAPDWSLLQAPGIAELPAVRGRQERLEALDEEARAVQLRLLADVVRIDPSS
jgi:hypothetical protein